MKSFVVKVGNSQELSRIVQELLFRKGYEWMGSGPTTFYEGMVRDHQHDSHIIVRFGCSHMECANSVWVKGSGYKLPFFDASTEFGQFIAYLSDPGPITIKGERNTYEIQPSGDVKCGCATVPSKEVEEIIAARAKLMAEVKQS